MEIERIVKTNIFILISKYFLVEINLPILQKIAESTPLYLLTIDLCSPLVNTYLHHSHKMWNHE